MSEPTEKDEIFIILDEMNESTSGDLVDDLSKELDIPHEIAETYVTDWLHHNGE